MNRRTTLGQSWAVRSVPLFAAFATRYSIEHAPAAVVVVAGDARCTFCCCCISALCGLRSHDHAGLCAVCCVGAAAASKANASPWWWWGVRVHTGYIDSRRSLPGVPAVRLPRNWPAARHGLWVLRAAISCRSALTTATRPALAPSTVPGATHQTAAHTISSGSGTCALCSCSPTCILRTSRWGACYGLRSLVPTRC
jgi:hypothetical protein